MAILEIKPYLERVNPYRTSFPKNSSPSKRSSHEHTLIQRIVKYGQKKLFIDHEKSIDLVAQATYFADRGTSIIYGGLQGLVFVDDLLANPFYPRSFWDMLPVFVKILAIPIAIAMLVLSIFQILFECNNLRRILQFIYRKFKSQPVDKLNWIKNHFFSLNGKETKKIYRFIEKKLPQLPKKEKADRFDQIAQKVLKIKYHTLQRRVTPWLAKEIQSKLKNILFNLRSEDKIVKNQARFESENLIKAIDQQTKKKILVHALAIAILLFVIVDFVILMLGIPLVVSTVLGILSTLLAVFYFLINRTILPQKGWKCNPISIFPQFIQNYLKKTPKQSEVSPLKSRVTV